VRTSLCRRDVCCCSGYSTLISKKSEMNLHTLVAPVLATSNGGTVILHSPISKSEHQVECKQHTSSIHSPEYPQTSSPSKKSLLTSMQPQTYQRDHLARHRCQRQIRIRPRHREYIRRAFPDQSIRDGEICFPPDVGRCLRCLRGETAFEVGWAGGGVT